MCDDDQSKTWQKIVEDLVSCMLERDNIPMPSCYNMLLPGKVKLPNAEVTELMDRENEIDTSSWTIIFRKKKRANI